MNAPNANQNAARSALKQAIWDQNPLFVRAAWFSLVSGLLMLAPSWFMLEVYGRVLNSRNITTLLMLVIAVLGIYAVMELLEMVRARVLQRASTNVDELLRVHLFDSSFQANLRRPSAGHVQAFSDLKTLRDFIPCGAVTACMDIPAALVFMALLFVISPWLGVMALVGALLQVGLAAATERRTMPLLSEATTASIEANAFASSALRNAPVVEAMGMLKNLHARWMSRQHRFLSRQSAASDYAGFTTVTAKLIQTMQSSLLLGAACWLALHNDLMGGLGMMIVASLLGARVLAPLGQLVAQWRLVVGARDAWRRLESVFSLPQVINNAMPLPPPKGVLTVENVVAGALGSSMPILRGVKFGLMPGEVLAVVGPSASGKTSLARVLMGIWPASAGKVRLDGVDVYTWNKTELGPNVGYLPQNVELFDGTVAENIARFGRVDTALVEEAVQQAGIHEFIQTLPEGIDTRIGVDGANLSGGQRQRIGLARAVYGQPQFIVLDEPNASLDEAGEAALVKMLSQLKARRATVVVITHRTAILTSVDKLLVLADGQVAVFGPRDEALAALKQANDQTRAKAAASASTGPSAPRVDSNRGAA
jgi:ATP-binding cassette subfamily C exporter for protease/lipase